MYAYSFQNVNDVAQYYFSETSLMIAINYLNGYKYMYSVI